ncbi:MAG: hypothetical protein RR599_04515 [Victivallaceae bacterium]
MTAFVLGWFSDICSDFVFNSYTILYSLTAYLCYPLHKFFFKDKILSIPLITIFFSIVFSCLSYLVLPCLGVDFEFSYRLITLDLRQALLTDFVYSLLICVLPAVMIDKINRLVLLIKRFKIKPIK